MIPRRTLILLTSLYEEYEYAADPTTPAVRRAKLVFDSECRRIYDAESPGLRDKMSLEKYIAAVVIPDVLRQIQSSPPPPSI
jgi:hypothetical protein